MRRACACNDYGRSHAVAGDGLPAIEAGMPAPAGTGLSRRSFLSRGLGLALTVYGLDRLSVLELDEGIAGAATTDRVLVSIFLVRGRDLRPSEAPVAEPVLEGVSG